MRDTRLYTLLVLCLIFNQHYWKMGYSKQCEIIWIKIAYKISVGCSSKWKYLIIVIWMVGTGYMIIIYVTNVVKQSSAQLYSIFDEAGKSSKPSVVIKYSVYIRRCFYLINSYLFAAISPRLQPSINGN